jgi:hypothetical protein
MIKVILFTTLFAVVVAEEPYQVCIKLMEYLLNVQETSFLEYCKLAAEYCSHTLLPEWCAWFAITYEDAIFNAIINKENPERFCKMFINQRLL